jgi:YegS/Rv2252/BmrU family lipid kinase
VGSILYIINPAGHGGAGIRVWEELQSRWPDRIDSRDVHFTERQGHAGEIATSAEGYDILTAVGGDGTVGEVLTGIMAHRGPRPKLAMIPAGTCNAIGRAVGIYSLEDAVDALRGDHARKFDLIKIECQVDGRKAHRYAFLGGTVGFSAGAMAKPWMKRLLGPTVGYCLSIFLGILAYRVPHMTVRWDEQEFSERAWGAYAANVEWTGADSICIAPGAQPDDGELRVVIVPSRSKLNFVAKFMPKVPSGKHVKEPGVSYFSAKKIEVDCEHPGLVEIDGDIFGTAPATFSICPRAVQILCPGKADMKGA